MCSKVMRFAPGNGVVAGSRLACRDTTRDRPATKAGDKDYWFYNSHRFRRGSKENNRQSIGTATAPDLGRWQPRRDPPGFAIDEGSEPTEYPRAPPRRGAYL